MHANGRAWHVYGVDIGRAKQFAEIVVGLAVVVMVVFVGSV